MTTVEDIRALFPEIDLDRIREKYDFERERRVRGDATKLYRQATGDLANLAGDPYTPIVDRDPVTDSVEVTVLGGGLSGIAIGARLKKAGIASVRNIDDAGDFGGVWYWNRYPGVRCDIESHVYLPMLEETGYMPTERYAAGDVIREQLQALARKFDLYENALFHTEVTAATWENGGWMVETNRGDRFFSKFVIVAVGPTATIKFPAIPGIDTFKGKIFHSSRWDYSYTGGDQHGGLEGLRGKKVAVIGTGATGIQIVPGVAEYAEHLYVMQRTPANVDFRHNMPTDEDWVGPREPGWQERRMDNFMQNTTGALVDEDLIADGWTEHKELLRRHNTGEYISEFAGEVREAYEEYLDARVMESNRARIDSVVEHPETAELLKPWYRWACKRPNFSDLYLPTFNRPNVTLVDTADTGGVTRMTENSIWVGDTEYEVDLVVFATGFALGTSGILSGSIPVTGREGRTLRETWTASGGVRLLHGYMTHEFPNFFQLGPTQSVNNINFAHVLQLHGEHVVEMIRLAREAGADYIEPSVEHQEGWLQTIVANRRTDLKSYQAVCTPGNNNAEGNPFEDGQFGPGPIPFKKLLIDWRAQHIDEVLHFTDESSRPASELVEAGAE